MADLNHRVTELENEIKVIKNEVKAILLDVREQYLNAENPFLSGAAAAQGGQFSTVVSCQTESSSKPASPADAADIKEPDEEQPQASLNDESDNDDGSDDENGAGGNNEKGKKNKKSTLPTLSMGPDTGEGKKSHGGKLESKLKGASSRFAAGEDDDDDPFYGDPRFAKDSWQKGGRQSGGKNGKGHSGNINLLTIAALSRWVDESTEKIGKERAEVMVEACYLVGHISNEFKDLLIRLVRLSQAEEPKRGKINTQDYLGVIARLDGLLGYNDGSESALLSILTDSKESHYG